MTKFGPVWSLGWLWDVFLALFSLFMIVVAGWMLWMAPNLKATLMTRILIVPFALMGPLYAFTLWMSLRYRQRINAEIDNIFRYVRSPAPMDPSERTAWLWTRRNYFAWLAGLLLMIIIVLTEVLASKL
jgi:hypothetical protein